MEGSYPASASAKSWHPHPYPTLGKAASSVLYSPREYEGIAQLAEHLTFNQGVAGSSPATLTRRRCLHKPNEKDQAAFIPGPFGAFDSHWCAHASERPSKTSFSGYSPRECRSRHRLHRLRRDAPAHIVPHWPAHQAERQHCVIAERLRLAPGGQKHAAVICYDRGEGVMPRKLRELRADLRRAGWEIDRQTGSHQIRRFVLRRKPTGGGNDESLLHRD
jgi:hypothetical protein